jgi:hypothetical protein
MRPLPLTRHFRKSEVGRRWAAKSTRLYTNGHRLPHDRRGGGHRRPRPLVTPSRQMSVFSAISIASSTSMPR